MKTIAAIEKMGLDTITSPCSACYSRLKTAEQAVCENEKVEKQVRSAIDYDYKGSVEVRHLVEIIVDRTGTDKVTARVMKPLTGLKVACYYGCLITRPPKVTGTDNPEYPVKMDRLLKALGAEPVEWGNKTECCGGSLGITMPETAAKLMRRVMGNARDCGAEAIVTMCPICHLNLDSRQAEMGFEEEMPIFQATQLMALAFGLDEKKAALNHNLIDPKPYLRKKGVLS
jgi:heterodisulfide reductase subunit B